MVAPASELPVVTTVPVASGRVIVRSAVGSVASKVVSDSSAVSPSKIIDWVNVLPAATPSTSTTRLLNWILNSSRVFSGVIDVAVIAIILYSLIVVIDFLLRESQI